MFEAGEVLDFVEVQGASMAFIHSFGPLDIMKCGRWARLGQPVGVRLVALGCVDAAVACTSRSTACYVPFEYR